MSMTTYVPGWSDRSGRPAVEQQSSLVFELLCQRFEADWRDDRHPAIEEFLAGVAEVHRPALLGRLLRIELDWRQRRLETHTLAEYLARFPNYAALVRDAFRPSSVHSTDHAIRSPRDTDVDPLPAGGGLPSASPPHAVENRAAHGVPANPVTGHIGNYELLAELARGGMGVVYRARQIGLGRIVALKMIVDRSLGDEEHRRRFRREAEAAGRLNHPGLVPIYEFGEHDGRLFYSMEFVEGRSLEQLVQRGPLPPCEAARIMADVADAVHYAHQHDIIHRDLKPSNILIDGLGRPRVADFGLARRLSADGLGTVQGQVLGTPSYMPPEQACGNLPAVGPQSDVYSLGATLYHLLTGRPPFLTASRHSTMHQVLTAAPVPPSTFDAGMPAELERICLKCLEKSPGRRHLSAGDLAYELRRAAGAATSPSATLHDHRRPWRLRRGWRWMMAAVVAALVTATVCYFAVQ